MFNKDGMARGDDPVGSGVKALVPFVIIRIATEDAQRGKWSQLMSGSGGEVRIADATKDTTMIEHRRRAKAGLLGVEASRVLVGRRSQRYVAWCKASTQ